jgi:hypothetical protein
MAAARPEFLHVGLTDSALLPIANDPPMSLTADVGLYISPRSHLENRCEFLSFSKPIKDQDRVAPNLSSARERPRRGGPRLKYAG